MAARTHSQDFDSLHDFITAATTGQVHASNASNTRRHMESERGSWYGTPGEAETTPELARLARDGWPTGAARIEHLAASITVPRLASVRRRRGWSDHGDEICMDRVRAGSLDNAWRRTMKRESSAPPRALVVVDSIASGGAKAETMFWRGAAAVALVQALTAAGYAVKAVSAFSGSCNGDIRCRVTVKPYESPWDMSSAAAALAMPGFFRGLGHAWYTRTTPWPVNSGMMVNELAMRDFEGDAPLVFLVPQSIRDEAGAHRWILDQVARLDPARAA